MNIVEPAFELAGGCRFQQTRVHKTRVQCRCTSECNVILTRNCIIGKKIIILNVFVG